MLNQCTIMGRIVAAPELRATTNGTSVTAFTIACDRDIKQDGQNVVDFIDCVAWRSTAEFIPRHFGKGDPITVTGRLQFRKWTDKEGNARRNAEIMIEKVYFCGKSNGNHADGTADFTGIEFDELPY